MGSPPTLNAAELALRSPPPALARSTPAAPSSSKRVGSSQQQEQDYTDSAYDITEFGQGGKYLRNKRKKLQHQQAGLVDADDEIRPQLFRGMSIYINGITLPLTLPQISGLIALHGGIHVPYLDKKSLATHIVASNLPPSKAEEFRKSKSKVATPDWIVDSVKEGRLLDWRDYSLFKAREKGAEGEMEGLFGYDDGAARLGTQFGQRSLFGMGVQRGVGPAEGGASASGRSPVKRKVEMQDKQEPFKEQGERLARETLQQAALAPKSILKRSAPKSTATPRLPPPSTTRQSSSSNSIIRPSFLHSNGFPSMISQLAPLPSAAKPKPSLPALPITEEEEEDEEEEAPPGPSVPAITQPPPNQRALKKEISVLVLSDSEDEEAPREVVKKEVATKGKKEIKKEKVKEDVTAKVKLERSPPVAPSSRSSSSPPSTEQISNADLLHYKLDPLIFRSLPPSLQSEQLAEARRALLPPKPPKPKQRTLGLSSSKWSLQPRVKNKNKVKHESRSPTPPPAVDTSRDSTPTDEDVLSLGFDLEVFRSLKPKEQRQHLKARQGELDRLARPTVIAPRRQARILGAEMREVAVREPPRLMKQIETEDICALIEKWVMEGREAAPEKGDAERVNKWFERCVEGKVKDVPKAVEVLRWWEMVLVDLFGRETEGVGKAWFEEFGRTKERVEEAVRRTCGGELVDL